MTEPKGPGPSYRLRSVERALDTLELLAAAGPDGVALTELAMPISGPRGKVILDVSVP